MELEGARKSSEAAGLQVLLPCSWASRTDLAVGVLAGGGGKWEKRRKGSWEPSLSSCAVSCLTSVHLQSISF